jgi:hypothetical protein
MHTPPHTTVAYTLPTTSASYVTENHSRINRTSVSVHTGNKGVVNKQPIIFKSSAINKMEEAILAMEEQAKSKKVWLMKSIKMLKVITLKIGNVALPCRNTMISNTAGNTER